MAKWSTEARKAASARMKRQMAERAEQLPGGPTEAQVMIAQNTGRRAESTEDIRDLLQMAPGQEDTGKVTHRGPGMVTVYKPTPWGYFPRSIPVTNLSMALDNGFLPSCPDCGGRCGPGVNSCAGRPSRAFRVCPVPSCSKHIYDYQMGIEDTDFAEDDPSYIRDDSYVASTPASRTKVSLDAHMLAVHPSEAASMGIVPLGVGSFVRSGSERKSE